MQIISNRRLLFQDFEYTKDEAGTILAKEKASIFVNPHTLPQIVPDWVKSTKLFELAVEDGNIIEVTVASVPKAPKKPNSDIKFEAKKIPEAEVVGAPSAKWPEEKTGLGK
jgi:hypothetical protein